MMVGLDFDSYPFFADLELFNIMEVAGSMYEVFGAPYQTKNPSVYANQAIGQKTQGGESALSTGSANNRANKRKNKYFYCSNSDNPDTLLSMIHGDGNSSEEFKVLWYYRGKYKFQKSVLGGKITNGKRVNFNKTEVNGEELNTVAAK